MSANSDAKLAATPEQMLYAKVLEIGMLIGLIMLFVTFAIYLFGLLDPHVPMHELPKYWSMSVHEYLETANVEAGWAWFGMLDKGDFLNFTGIAVLAGVTIICYASIIPTLLRGNDKVYALFALLEVLILSLAASGILASGH